MMDLPVDIPSMWGKYKYENVCREKVWSFNGQGMELISFFH